MAKKILELKVKLNKSGDVETLVNEKFLKKYCWLNQERCCNESCIKFIESPEEDVFFACDLKCKIIKDERIRK